MAMPTIAPSVKGPVGPDGVNDAVGVGVVTLTMLEENMLPCMDSVDPCAGCNVQAPSNTLRSADQLDKFKHDKVEMTYNSLGSSRHSDRLSKRYIWELEDRSIHCSN
jgi:hypothetical protein